MLLDAAADVFDRRGFRDASMVEVAAQAGATKPTLYARFGNKEAIYDRVMRRMAESLIAAVAESYERIEEHEGDPDAATLLPVKAFFDWVRSHPVSFHLLFSTDPGAPAGIDHRDRALAQLTNLIAEATATHLRQRGLRSGRMTALLAAYGVGVMHHGALWAVEHDALDRSDLAGISTTFILNGLHGVDPDTLASLRRRRPTT